MPANPKGLQNVLGAHSRQHRLIAAYRPVTEPEVQDLLADNQRDPFSQFKRFAGGDTGGAYGTGGHHVGRLLTHKFQPEGLDKEGPDPQHTRQFLGEEFKGMLMFGRGSENAPAQPAFYSLWPEGTPPEGRKRLKINVATASLPSYMTDPQGTVAPALKKQEILLGRPLESVFHPVDRHVTKALANFAESFEKTFGIALDVQIDHPKPDITVMGYSEGRRDNTAGFASFPKAVRDWEQLAEFAHTPGYALINMDIVPKLDKRTIQQLVTHELLHCMGLAHPHDLAIFRSLKQDEAMTVTAMAYSDLRPLAIGRDGDAGFGTLDFGLRKWVSNPPALNSGDQVFDMEKAHKASLRDNDGTATFKAAGLLPTVSLFAHGSNNTLQASRGNDFLDTNPGYASRMVDGKGHAQKFALVEGHFDGVDCLAGTNTLVTSATGDQRIRTGAGSTDVQFLYPHASGCKTVEVENGARVTLTASLLKAQPGLNAEAAGEGWDIVGKDDSGKGVSIHLTGNTPDLQLLDENGHVLFAKTRLSGEAFRDAFSQMRQVAQAHVAKDPDIKPDMPGNWQERVQRQEELASELVSKKGQAGLSA